MNEASLSANGWKPQQGGQVELPLFVSKDCSVHEADRHRQDPSSLDKPPGPSGETIQLTPLIKMARVPSKVDSESRDTFISQSTWRTSGLPEVTQPVNPNLLTPFWHILYFYRGGCTEKQVDLSSL